MWLLHREPLEGREAIREHWRDDVGAARHVRLEPGDRPHRAHGDHAIAFRTYTERLRNREDGSRTLVRGRLALLMRRGRMTAGAIRMLMNSHSHPMEPIE